MRQVPSLAGLPGQHMDRSARALRERVLATHGPELVLKLSDDTHAESYALASVIIDVFWAWMKEHKARRFIRPRVAYPSYDARVEAFQRTYLGMLQRRQGQFVTKGRKASKAAGDLTREGILLARFFQCVKEKIPDSRAAMPSM